MQVCLDLEEKCFYRLSNTGYASPNELIGVQPLFSHFGISKSFLLFQISSTNTIKKVCIKHKKYEMNELKKLQISVIYRKFVILLYTLFNLTILFEMDHSYIQ